MTTTPTTITVRAPHDLIAAAAVVLGFWPTESVVLLTFGSREPFHARVDLPDADHVASVTDLLLAPVLRHRVDRVVVLLFCDDERRASPVWRALRDSFAAHRVDVIEALRADGQRWYPLAGGDRTLREIGVPYNLEAHPFLAHAVFSGQVLRHARAELSSSIDPDPQGVLAIERAVTSLPAKRRIDPVEAPADKLLAEAEWAVTLVAVHLLAGTTPSDEEAARLLWSLQQSQVCDAAWSALRRPLARQASEFWGDIVRRSPDWLLAAPATILGWSAWLAGDGALAWCAVDRALDVDPDFYLARLLGDAMNRAVPPSAWDELCSDAAWASFADES